MTKRIVTILAVGAIFSGIAYARRMTWNSNSRPPVSLRLALALGEAELINEETEYFCIGASIARTFSEGDWLLHFSSEDGKTMWISVASDKSLRKSEHGFEY